MHQLLCEWEQSTNWQKKQTVWLFLLMQQAWKILRIYSRKLWSIWGERSISFFTQSECHRMYEKENTIQILIISFTTRHLTFLPDLFTRHWLQLIKWMR